METFQLIEKCILEKYSKLYNELRLVDYDLNGTIINIKYGYVFTYSSGGIDINYSHTEIELLDYITWVFNQCKHKQ